jgi:hypothetical protein
MFGEFLDDVHLLLLVLDHKWMHKKRTETAALAAVAASDHHRYPTHDINTGVWNKFSCAHSFCLNKPLMATGKIWVTSASMHVPWATSVSQTIHS